MKLRRTGVAAALLSSGLLFAGNAFSMSGHAFLDFANATISFTPFSQGAAFSVDMSSAFAAVSTQASVGNPTETAVGSASFFGTGVTPATMLRDIDASSAISVGNAQAAVHPLGDLLISADGILVSSAGRTSEAVKGTANASVNFTVTGAGFFYITIPTRVTLDTSTITDTTAKSGEASTQISYFYGPEVEGASGASGSGESHLRFKSTATIQESGEQALGFGFLNTSGTVRGMISAQALVSLSASPVAVPEPAPYGMLAAGLSLLGALSLRRKRA